MSLVGVAPLTAQSDYRIGREVTNGLPSPIVTAMAQDGSGFLWIGTPAGLARFDGAGVVAFDPEIEGHGLPPGPVRDVLVDDRDAVWVAIEGGGVFRYRAAEDDGFVRIGDFETGHALHLASDGAIWVGLDAEEIRVVEPSGAITAVEMPTEARDDERDHRISVFAEGGGYVWAATFGGQIYRIPEGRRRAELAGSTRDRDGATPAVRALTVDADGRLWMGTSGTGITVLDEANARRTVFNATAELGRRLPRNDIMDFAWDEEGALWASTYGNGIVKIDAASLEVVDVPEPGPEGRATGVLVSADGTVWVGTWGGGFRAYRRPRPGITRSELPSLGGGGTARDVTDVSAARDGGVWVTEYGAGLFRLDSSLGAVETYGIQPERAFGLPPRLYRVLEDSSGRVWVGTWGVGLQVLEPGSDRFVTVETGWGKIGTVTALHEDSLGALWVGTRDGLARLDPASMDLAVIDTEFRSGDDSSPWVKEIRAAPDGTLVVGSEVGLLRIDPTSLEGQWLLRREGGLIPPSELAIASVHVAAVEFGPEGDLWVGIEQSGILQVGWDGGFGSAERFEIVRIVDAELPSDGVRDIAFDADGDLWVSTRKGLTRIDPVAGSSRTFFEEDGIVDDEGSANGLLWHRDRLLHASVDGLTVVDPDLLPTASSPMQVVVTGIRRITASGVEVDLLPGSRLTLPWRKETALIDIAVFQVATSLAPEYEYRLGSGEPWRMLGETRTVAIGDNPPGSYSLQFRARTGGRLLAPPTAPLVVDIVPPWWLTWWARLAFALTIAGIAAAIILNRFHRLAAHNRALRLEIERRRTAEAQRDDMEEQFRRAQRLEAVGKLTGGVAHDFNNILTVIQGNLDLITLEHPEGEETGMLARECLSAAEQASHLTQQLLSFSRKQLLTPSRVEVRKILHNMEILLRTALGSSYRLVLHVEDGIDSLVVDGAHLESALLNLVLNARDAQPGGGHIEVAARPVTLSEEDLVRIDPESRVGDGPQARPGPFILFSVQDQGEGMSEQVRRQVFEPFFTTKAPGDGTGLGLSMVYGFVRQSRGLVAIESELGVGTRIEIYLPGEPGPADSGEVDSSAGVAESRR